MFPRFNFRSLLLVVAATGLLAACGPQGSKADPQPVLERAWTKYRIGEFDAAITDFESVARQSEAGSEENLQALYGLGTTWAWRRPDDDRAKASGYFQQAVETGGDHDAVAWSLLGLARLKDLRPVGQTSDSAEVIAAYQEVIDRFPKHRAGEEAFLYQQSEWMLSDTPENGAKVLAALTNFLESRPDSEWASTVYGMISSAYAMLDRPAEGMEWSIRSVEEKEFDPRNPKRDNAGAYWNLALKAEFDLGEFDLARRYYRRLIEEYSTDQRVFPAKLALERLDETEARVRAEIAAAQPAPAR